jgi:hypothetical protein
MFMVISQWPMRWFSLRFVSAMFFMAFQVVALQADDWPQWLGPKRDGVWREKGIVEKFPEGGPQVLWRKDIAAGYSGPAVANGRVYVTDHVRPPKPKKEGNKEPEPDASEKERILCLDAKDGNLIWKHEYDCKYARIGYSSGPRTTRWSQFLYAGRGFRPFSGLQVGCPVGRTFARLQIGKRLTDM